MIIIIATALIYLVSMHGAYQFMLHAFYHKHGKYSGLEHDAFDIICILCPIVNTLIAYEFYKGYWKDE